MSRFIANEITTYDNKKLENKIKNGLKGTLAEQMYIDLPDISPTIVNKYVDLFPTEIKKNKLFNVIALVSDNIGSFNGHHIIELEDNSFTRLQELKVGEYALVINHRCHNDPFKLYDAINHYRTNKIWVGDTDYSLYNMLHEIGHAIECKYRISKNPLFCDIIEKIGFISYCANEDESNKMAEAYVLCNRNVLDSRKTVYIGELEKAFKKIIN